MDYDCEWCKYNNECSLAYEETDCLIDNIMKYNAKKEEIKQIINMLDKCLDYMRNNKLEKEFDDLYRNINFARDTDLRNDEEIKYAIGFKKYMSENN